MRRIGVLPRWIVVASTAALWMWPGFLYLSWSASDSDSMNAEAEYAVVRVQHAIGPQAQNPQGYPLGPIGPLAPVDGAYPGWYFVPYNYNYGYSPWQYQQYGGVYEPYFGRYRFFPNVQGYDPRFDPRRHNIYPWQYAVPHPYRYGPGGY